MICVRGSNPCGPEAGSSLALLPRLWHWSAGMLSVS